MQTSVSGASRTSSLPQCTSTPPVRCRREARMQSTRPVAMRMAQRPPRAAVQVVEASPSSGITAPAVASTSAPAVTAVVDDFASDRRPVILYDGVCNLCNGGVNLMLDLDPQGRFRMAALQSPAGRRLLQRCGRTPDDISSIVLVEPGDRFYLKSEAVLRIGAGLSNPLPWLAWFGFPFPLFIRDTVYDLVANNRYSILGKRDVCRLSDDRFTERFIVA